MNGLRNFVVPMRAVTARAVGMFVVGAVIIGYFGHLAWPATSEGVQQALSGVRLVGMVAACPLCLSVWGHQLTADDRRLDERQQRDGDRALTLTYRFMLFTALISVIYLGQSDRLGLPLPNDIRTPANMLSAYVVLSMVLPSIILAWREPALAEADEE